MKTDIILEKLIPKAYFSQSLVKQCNRFGQRYDFPPAPDHYLTIC